MSCGAVLIIQLASKNDCVNDDMRFRAFLRHHSTEADTRVRLRLPRLADVVATGRKLFNTSPHTHRERDEGPRTGIVWHDNHITITSRKICPTVG